MRRRSSSSSHYGRNGVCALSSRRQWWAGGSRRSRRWCWLLWWLRNRYSLLIRRAPRCAPIVVVLQRSIDSPGLDHRHLDGLTRRHGGKVNVEVVGQDACRREIDKSTFKQIIEQFFKPFMYVPWWVRARVVEAQGSSAVHR